MWLVKTIILAGEKWYTIYLRQGIKRTQPSSEDLQELPPAPAHIGENRYLAWWGHMRTGIRKIILNFRIWFANSNRQQKMVWIQGSMNNYMMILAGHCMDEKKQLFWNFNSPQGSLRGPFLLSWLQRKRADRKGIIGLYQWIFAGIYDSAH